MVAMAAGLLLMPCGLVHGAWRVWCGKLDVQERPDAWFGLAYLPLVCLVPVALWFFAPERGSFSELTLPWAFPYFLFSGLANVVAATVFLRARERLDFPHARRFFLRMALVLVGITALHGLVLFLTAAAPPDVEKLGRLAVALSPLVPALLFAYFVIRYHFLQIILGGSIVYGAVLASILLFHQLAFQDVSAAVPESLRLHVVILEAVVLGVVILAYQPLRQRTAEALRYLFGMRVSAARERLRQLSIELSAQAGRRPHDVLVWFVDALGATLQLEYVVGWLFDEVGKIDFRCGQTPLWADERAAWLYQRMRQADLLICSFRHEGDGEVLHCLQAAAASLAIVKSRPHVAGLLVMGRGRNNRDLSDEETNAVLLLVEQLAITLDNSLLQAKQLAAERKALQDEKLATLGLLTSSIAHEVKNPLSAIKTIATVLAEELGPESPYAEDLRLILGEVERLVVTTTQLLDTTRPRATCGRPLRCLTCLRAHFGFCGTSHANRTSSSKHGWRTIFPWSKPTSMPCARFSSICWPILWRPPAPAVGSPFIVGASVVSWSPK